LLDTTTFEVNVTACNLENTIIFTVRRYAKRSICRRRVSVCLSVCVCVSITLRYCIKTAKRRMTQLCRTIAPWL